MNTILQKRIEEAAENIVEDYNHYQFLNDGTKDVYTQSAVLFMLNEMAQFILSNQWISVKEALPEIVDGYRSALVIVRSKYNSYDVAKWDEYYKDWITPDYAVANVTHWMPMPSLKGGEK